MGWKIDKHDGDRQSMIDAYHHIMNSIRFTNYGGHNRTIQDLYTDYPERGGRYLGTIDESSGEWEFHTRGPVVPNGRF